MKNIVKKIVTFVLSTVAIIIYQCPIRLFFGIECPGCGLTAAVLSALRFDFKSAFSYHPLFLLPVITIVYLLFRKRFTLPKNVEIVLGLLIIIAFLTYYIIKFTKMYC